MGDGVMVQTGPSDGCGHHAPEAARVLVLAAAIIISIVATVATIAASLCPQLPSLDFFETF